MAGIVAPAIARITKLGEHFAPRRPGVTLLDYGSDRRDADEVVRQLAHLGAHHRVVSIDEAVRSLSREDHAVDGSVVITVDDSPWFHQRMLPELVERRLPATLYVGADVSTPFTAVREALATGMVTLGVSAMDPLSVAESLDRVSTAIGVAPLHFSYPGARPFGQPGRDLVATSYRTAAVHRPGVNRVGRTDLHRIHRTPVPHGVSIESFDRRLRAAAPSRA